MGFIGHHKILFKKRLSTPSFHDTRGAPGRVVATRTGNTVSVFTRHLLCPRPCLCASSMAANKESKHVLGRETGPVLRSHSGFGERSRKTVRAALGHQEY